MNMAFTAGCLFILQCIFLTDISVADPLIDVSPSAITLGVTSTLDINCTFSINNHPDLAALASLVLSRANATGQTFEDLAAITEFSPDSVTLLTQEKVSATGVNSQIGETFLHLTWQYPTALQAGVYRCFAYGLDNIGRNVEMTNISSVTVDEANLNDIFDKLHQLEMHEAAMGHQIQNLENEKISMQQKIQNLKNENISTQQKIQNLENENMSMEQKIETLNNDKISMEEHIHNLENKTETLENKTQTLEKDKSSLENFVSNLKRNISRLEVVVASITGTAPHVDFIGSYGTKDYYVSSYAFTDIHKSIDVCKSLGGTLAVIDNQDEYTAVNHFLTATSGFKVVYISGTDEQTEGNWVLPGTNTPLPFTAWNLGRPDTDSNRNCLMLESGYQWNMNDWNCYIGSPNDIVRFMCEI